jgi:hypothetical protein
MIRKLLLAAMLLLATHAFCQAQSFELDLTAGATSVSGGVHYKSYLESGYFRMGASGVYTDDDDSEYKWGSLNLMVGSDTLLSGLSCDVGMRGIFGSADDASLSGDVGALGFTGSVGYLFPRNMIPVPMEIFGGLTWAPRTLTFMDTEDYFEFNAGIGFRIIPSASIVGTYTKYDVEMESGPGDWTLSDDVLRVGLVMRF